MIAIERKILVAFAVAFLTSLIVGITLYRNATEIFSSQRRVEHTKQVMDQLDELQQSFIGLNSAWIGSHLTLDERLPDEGFLPTVDAFRETISRQLDQISELTAKSTPSEQEVALLHSAAASTFNSIGDWAKAGQPVGTDEKVTARARLVNGNLNQVQSTLRRMMQAESEHFDSSFALSRQSTKNTVGIVISTFAIQFAILGLLYWLLQRDVSERRRTEETLRQGSVDLAAARDSAVSAAEVKSQFLANMSHEIRTPMNGVLGMTEILLDTPLTARQREFAETIQSSGDALLAIINDILDFSKIEAGMIRFESVPFNLHTTIESIVDLFVQSARKKGLELAFLVEEQIPVSVAGDPFRLRQVLTNLLSNAIKFTHSGEVVLRCAKLPQSNGTITARFEISDTGIGLSPEDQESLFSPFVQADASTTRRFGGTGLGLAISRQLVTGMGGKMGIESSLGVGSKFWFTVKFEAVEALGPSRLQTGDLRNVRVLLVDDNATNRKILHYQVSAWGMRDSVASSGPAALTLLRKGAVAGDPYAVAILDGHMPEMTGSQVVELIRADQTIANVKVVLLTSLDPSGINKDLRDQVDAFISKPVKQSQLFKTLCAVIGAGVGRPAVEAELNILGSVSSPLHDKRLRVLLAEDNNVNQRLALYQLRMLEHYADLARDGVEALTLFDKHEYDVILMDIHMPKLDGYLATAEIRRREENRNHKPTWIIATTANAMPGDREKCLATGMDDYLAKPIQTRALVYALEKYVISVEQKGIVGVSPDGQIGKT